ncbi:alpha/beta fold hydrolase [Microvirga lotononidis]|uniref:Putative hydrolase or acyltransferase of alpha/beta superfamily n=1 Tax=Microvirga lotononidis TaxID=864069 RepID=I4YZU9_9HYPH|nr:alpha/beta fold hydrolase [Microvirga lotononidis]EIM29491.1 putative hydrolase or acyltransferase of alpha/beta superfamily [Microvirga lotononidis]WQO27194.1 alpha/beta fold hydrolase [Microvirga lotononidis]
MVETLVLIPGLACTARLFAPQIAALSTGCTIVVADNAQDDSIAAMAGRLLRDVPGTFALAGLSMGGYIAMEVMRLAPERVERLALLDTSARPDTPEASRDRERLIALAEAGRLDEIHSALWPRLVHPDHRNDRDLQDALVGMMRETGAEAYIRQQRAIMARADSRPSLPGIEIPTLVLVGEGDSITPPEIAREMAEMIEWASLVVVPDAGHMSTLEQPDRVIQAMQLWLSRS